MPDYVGSAQIILFTIIKTPSIAVDNHMICAVILGGKTYFWMPPKIILLSTNMQNVFRAGRF